MKKLFTILLTVSLLTMGSAFAAVDLQPSSSNACTFDNNALTGIDDDLIVHITYAEDEAYMEIIFGMRVDFSDDLTVTITDKDGNEYPAEILSRDWSNLKVWADGLALAQTHQLTISDVSASDGVAHPEYAEPAAYTVSFVTVPSCCV